MQAITFENVSFAYSDENPVLNGTSFEVAEGEFVALVGNNGSGKSTIAKMSDALILPAKGKVYVLGRDIAEVAKKGSNDLLELRCGIGFVQQNPDNQFVAARVIDEVAFGPCGLGIPKDEVIERACEALEQVGAIDLRERDVNTLSGGEKQRIAIADALSMRPKLFIFDEPASMLDEEGEAQIMSIIKDLHEGGASILLITHSISQAKCADRSIKIENGQIVDSPDLDLDEKEIWKPVEQYTGHEPIKCYLRSKGAAGEDDKVDAENLISFSDVSFEYNGKNDLVNGMMGIPSGVQPVFSNLNLQVARNEFLCVAGPNGSGKSTLASLMNGLLKPTSGQVVVCGIPTSDKKGANAARRRVGVCFQYPEKSLFSQTVLNEVAFGPKNLGHSKEEAEAMAIDALGSVGIHSEDTLGSSPFSLSGGLQRKVAFASVLSMAPDVLVLDEPCAGLDMEAHADLIMLLLKLKESGQSIVMITHDKRDMDILADRVIFLS